MSVPYRVDPNSKSHKPSACIPAIARPFISQRASSTLDTLSQFIDEECVPADAVYAAQIKAAGEADPDRNIVQGRFGSHPAVIEDLKARAKTLGLWNLWIPKGHGEQEGETGSGFTNVEYALMAEVMGKSNTGSEACNCAAPDTGNMEVLLKYGNKDQKREWLQPLLDGKIRSAFLMTEPQVASSDATNIAMNMRREGDEWVLNGQKWWSSGAGDKRCEIYVVMAKSDPLNTDKHKRQSIVLVPANAPGITVHRMLSVMGFDDAPHGHGHIFFESVRVPYENLVLGEGRGFEVVQGRLGPGRIHHAMRSLGSAEVAMDWFLARINDPTKKPFGKLLSEHGVWLERLARCRIQIDSARLAVLNAAIMIDTFGARQALREIAGVKVQVPEMLMNVLDWAMQAYGGAGVSQDTPLAAGWAAGRTMRIVDGPDEVHLLQLGRGESKNSHAARKRIQAQKKKSVELFARYGLACEDVLQLNRRLQKSKI